MYQRAEARIDLDALRHNVRHLRGLLAPGVELCPVLKADGYGHGAGHSASAVVGAGADRIAVATAREAVQIRSAEPRVPLLVLGALAPPEVEMAVSAGTDVSAWEPGFVADLGSRAEAAGQTVGVHVKYDTGMGRLGSADRDLVIEMCRSVATHPNLELKALWTHFATADEREGDFQATQRDRLAALGERIRSEFPDIKLHAANSAALIADPAAHFDMVRPGVAVYGLDPFGVDAGEHELRPAMSFHSYVASIKDFEPGMSTGYGRTWIADRPTRIATVPVGYGDGVRRGLSNRGDVLIGGRAFPISGTISMDNLTVDIGPAGGGEIRIGDEVTLIGSQGTARITAEQVAARLDTINYEVTCGISPRVPRRGVGQS
ncbi:MAG TPA: alanine racemase [Solirubrobacterales bacterium]|nr:alanine racemase [Solirubrobacterales bacterium]